MQKQKRVTDFFSSPVAKKSPSASPRTPLFELDTQLAVAKKPRVSLCETDVRQTILDAGQRKIGGQYCKKRLAFLIRSMERYEVLSFPQDLVNTSVGFSPDLSIWGWDGRRTVWVSILTEGSTHFIAGIIIAEPLKSAQYSDSGKV
ncbi:hypothetical protein ANCDUO_18369 [Ancylostoma duodenale]|uniref:Uncharacterized protein n=1 Tax=Ancylostoma duodenale TaxID=51022 RepID=A0A0C2FSI8_9BILA|nr:hypothetical protein ANCDUO_18369 [Ancylostoma duodenale]